MLPNKSSKVRFPQGYVVRTNITIRWQANELKYEAKIYLLFATAPVAIFHFFFLFLPGLFFETGFHLNCVLWMKMKNIETMNDWLEGRESRRWIYFRDTLNIVCQTNKIPDFRRNPHILKAFPFYFFRYLIKLNQKRREICNIPLTCAHQ